ncbi:MAG: hypothetical protein ACKOOG_06960 [Actinomycetota bacterium]
MPGPTEPGLTVAAVDWSGARRPKGIWLAVVRAGTLVESRPIATRETAIDAVVALPAPVAVGFDFSFSVPAWFAAELGCTSAPAVWRRAHTDGEAWLAPTPPFWRDRCTVPPEQRFRRCETRYPSAKSVFQLVGNGQVGAGSVRGMALLPRLRRAGFAIWPFDKPTDRVAFEIYPSALRPLVDTPGPFASNDERDAVASARAMWEHRATLGRLRQTDDPVALVEGDVWDPVSPSP